MSDERMIRIDNLKLLLKQEGWTQKELGLKLGFTTGAHVGKLIKKQTAFTEKTARKIEEVSGRPYRWMDVVHLSGEYSEESLKEAELLRDTEAENASIPNRQKTPPNKGEIKTLAGVVNPFDPLLPDVTNPKRAPVLDWARLGVDLTKATHELY
ncbi:MAG: helix-turn-helix domain-containing protein, partial [Aquabacterium sp.]|uniref:helix-turn-helix domain-containing protein n=1 Tax=Aquabacterium sp. TaxID=1872578 RepID=UPI00120E7690